MGNQAESNKKQIKPNFFMRNEQLVFGLLTGALIALTASFGINFLQAGNNTYALIYGAVAIFALIYALSRFR